LPDVYDALCRRGWRRLETSEQPGKVHARVLVESYPYAAWKALGLKPLPSKKRARVSDLAEAYGALRQLIPFTTSRPPNHDQLQAIVGGLAGLSLEARDAAGAQIVGPRRVVKMDIGARASSCCRQRVSRPAGVAAELSLARLDPHRILRK